MRENNTRTTFRKYVKGRLPAVAAVALAAAVAAPVAGAASQTVEFGYWGRALQSLRSVQFANLPNVTERAAVANPPSRGEKPEPAKAAPATKKAPADDDQPMPRKKWVTPSRYEETTKQSTLRRQGCDAGELHTNGIVVLAFGKPAYNGHTYGTILFSNRFAGNAEITGAMKAYAVGYARCLPEGSDAKITLVRGTSNYDPAVPKSYQAGLRWSRETKEFGEWLEERPSIAEHVTSAAGIDAEPAWDPAFHRTHAFFQGYRDAGNEYLLYNFGSLDGGVGSIWSLRQAFYVSGGMKYARVIPEIYFEAQARQWAELARLALKRYGRPVQFAGVMTQHWTNCNPGVCGFTARKAHSLLGKALKASPATRDQVRMLASVTNIN